MWLIWLVVALFVLKLAEVGVFAAMSWWWVVAAAVVAVVWFEFVERALGLDKKKAFDEIDEVRKERIEKALGIDKARKRP